MIALALLIAAFVLFVLAAMSVEAGRVNLTAAGLACWVASLLVQRL
jgi:hypothetical protein